MTTNFRKLALIAIFLFFLCPITLNGISVNYTFILFPLLNLFVIGKVRNAPREYVFIIFLYIFIFIISFASQFEVYGYVLRRIFSFIVFMSMFSFMFVKIDKGMIDSFKDAVVIVSLCFSIISISIFFLMGGERLGDTAKDIVGGQRFGFICLLAIWLVFLNANSNLKDVLIKYSFLLILLMGLALTFSRSSIVALCGSFGLFLFINVITWLKRPRLKIFLIGVSLTVAICILILSVYQFIPTTFAFFETRLFSVLFDHDAIVSDLTNPESSGGTRVYILGKIIDFVMCNPLSGSGYLGVWILNDPLFGSSHNQLADVLFRTGLIGFFVYFGLIVLLLRYLYANFRSLFWGVVSILIYGLFHETFKESQGGFVLAFLLGMMSQPAVNLKKMRPRL